MTDRSVTDLIPLAKDVSLVRAMSFRLLWVERRPVDPAEIATATGLALAEVAEEIDRIQSEGRLTLNSAGRVTGSGGLTVVPTRHQLAVSGRRLWTWCAVDAVGIMAAVEADGQVRSQSAETGARLTLTFEAGRLQESDVVVFIAEAGDNCFVVEQWCPTVNFFPDIFEAEAWVERTQIPGAIHRATEIADACGDGWRVLLDVALAHMTEESGRQSLKPSQKEAST